MENQNQLVAQPQQRALSVKQVKDHVAIVNQLLKEVLKEGKVEDGKIVKDGHYSKLPGCGEKMVLLKPGAEKLCFTFNLAPKYDKDITNIPESVDIPSGHINVDVTCDLYNRFTGEFVGQGIGFCSTLEGKYRYRTKWEGTGNNKTKKQIENPCIQDVYNTVIKMACKRALNHAVVQALAVGDIFMQDLDELDPNAYKDNDKPPKPEMTPPKSKSEKPACPSCGNSNAVINSKEEWGGGYVCYKKKGGCGHAWGGKEKKKETSGEGKIDSEQIKTINEELEKFDPQLKAKDKRDLVANILGKDSISSIKDISCDEADKVIEHMIDVNQQQG